MRSIPSQLLADLQLDATSIAFLWMIELSDGRVIRGTEHDTDLTLLAMSSPDKYAGFYPAFVNVTLGDIVGNSDLSVDNLEVTGAFDASTPVTVINVSVDTLESGLMDRAPVTVLVCNWKRPDHGYFIAKVGHIGTINHDSDGKYVTEVRGLTQSLAQTIIRTFSATCNVVKFGDVRCRFNVAGIATTGAVVADAGNTRAMFKVTVGSAAYPFVGGTLKFTTGLNSGFGREVKLDPTFNAGVIAFWEAFPEDIANGDAFTLLPGCDRQFTTCRDKYSNLTHFRGYGYFVPGVNEITAGPAKGMQPI